MPKDWLPKWIKTVQKHPLPHQSEALRCTNNDAC